MKLVKFKDGTWGVRRRVAFTYQFLDMDSTTWWERMSAVNRFCRGTEEQARKLLETMTDTGEPQP